ncbi:hypothetical protein [Qipengyuania aestuarii]|nr:hypothetical protein [Qipengyuania aestuarii]
MSDMAISFARRMTEARGNFVTGDFSKHQGELYLMERVLDIQIPI